MAIGMTYDEYWYGDPMMVRAYYKAEKLRREQADEDAWLAGQYMISALNATVVNLFRKPGQAPAEYPKEPVSLTQKRQKQLEKSERGREQEAVWAKAWMDSFVQAGKNFKKRSKKETPATDAGIRNNVTQEG